MSIGLNQTVEAKQLVVEEYITAGDYAGESYNKDLIFRAGDVEHSHNISFAVFSNGELSNIAKVDERGLHANTLLTNEIFTEDGISSLGKLNISHDTDSGEMGYRGQLTVNLNCGLSSGDAFVEALKVTSEFIEAPGDIYASSLISDAVNTEKLTISADKYCSVVAEFTHPHCKNNILIHESNDMLVLSGNVEANVLSACNVYIDNMYSNECVADKVMTNALKVESWSLSQDDNALNIIGPGGVCLHKLDCDECSIETASVANIKTNSIEIDSRSTIALSVGNACIMRQIGGDTYWKGGVVTENIQSDDFINIDTPEVNIGKLKLKSDGSIYMDDTPSIDIGNDVITMHKDMFLKGRLHIGEMCATDSVHAENISTESIYASYFTSESCMTNMLSAGEVYATNILTEYIGSESELILSNNTCRLHFQKNHIHVDSNMMLTNEIKSNKVNSDFVDVNILNASNISVTEISCESIGSSTSKMFFSDNIVLSGNTHVEGDLILNSSVKIGTTMISACDTTDNKYLEIGNNVKVVSDGGLCINSIPNRGTALLDITATSLDKPLLKITHDSDYLNINVNNNEFLFDANLPICIPLLSVGTLLGVETNADVHDSIATVGFSKSMFQPLTTSDDRIKSQTTNISNATGTLMKINPVKYQKHPTLLVPAGVEDTNLTGIPNFTEMGLVAQELEDIAELAFAVSVSTDFAGHDIKTVDYNSIFSLSIKALQEQALELSTQSVVLKSLDNTFSTNALNAANITSNRITSNCVDATTIGLDDVLCFNSKSIDGDIKAQSKGYASQIAFNKNASSIDIGFSAVMLSTGDIFPAQLPPAVKIHYTGMTIGANIVSPGLIVANEGTPTIQVGNNENNVRVNTKEDHSLFTNTHKKFVFDGDLLAEHIECNAISTTDVACNRLSTSNIYAVDASVQNLSVGNIFIAGSRTVVNVENTTTSSYIMTLGEGNPSSSEMMGIVMHYDADAENRLGGMVRDPSHNAFIFFENMIMSTGGDINHLDYDLASVHCDTLTSDNVATNTLTANEAVISTSLSVSEASVSVTHVGNWDIEEDSHGDLVFKNNGVVSFRMRKPA